MRKFLFFLMALTLTGTGLSFADVQIDRGQLRSTAAKKFFVARYARTCVVGDTSCDQNGEQNVISSGRVVIWDTTSNDGVTVQMGTTSQDPLVAGITLDEIPGSSRDNSAVDDDNYSNWGRVQTWGRFADVSFDGNGLVLAGHRAAHGPAIGQAVVYTPVSPDNNLGLEETGSYTAASQGSFGVFLEDATDGDATIDVFVNV